MKSDMPKVTCGVPQGSVSDPNLFFLSCIQLGFECGYTTYTPPGKRKQQLKCSEYPSKIKLILFTS